MTRLTENSNDSTVVFHSDKNHCNRLHSAPSQINLRSCNGTVSINSYSISSVSQYSSQVEGVCAYGYGENNAKIRYSYN